MRLYVFSPKDSNYESSSLSQLQDGVTPLMVASQDGHTSTVDVLLRNGADPNIAANVSAGCLDHEYGSTH